MGLSIVNITTQADLQNKAWQAMLASTPHGCEVVVLINSVGDACTEPTLDLDYCDPESKRNVRIYRVTYDSVDLARARNDATALATHEWCMWLDSDDMIVYGDAMRCVEQAPPSCAAYYCHTVGMQIVDGEHPVHYAVEQVRLWRRSSGMQWVGKAHEILDIKALENKYIVGKADIVIHHSGYVTDRNSHRMRLERNVRGVCETVVDVWDRRPDLRMHYLRVLRSNIDALLHLSNNTGD
ncbi:MAG: hypothetical protein KatS3mg038_2532 [Candidatus Kapaibacterium sp.]|nr:MAG: hypothetical protein KatS3mg038_2532 [Candidatus Kapabacteria bacterium]